MHLPEHAVHFLAEADRDAPNPLPLCGDWDGEPSWTTLPALVTCPGCLARLEAAKPLREA